MAILPSILGVHIFQHHCYGCDEDETITRIITTSHNHNHACEDCSCDKACHSCIEATGKHVHHHETDGACKHEFKKASLEGKITSGKYKIKVAAIDLFLQSTIVADLVSDNNTPKQLLFDVIQNIPDEPSPEMNCVFLL